MKTWAASLGIGYALGIIGSFLVLIIGAKFNADLQSFVRIESQKPRDASKPKPSDEEYIRRYNGPKDGKRLMLIGGSVFGSLVVVGVLAIVILFVLERKKERLVLASIRKE